MEINPKFLTLQLALFNLLLRLLSVLVFILFFVCSLILLCVYISQLSAISRLMSKQLSRSRRKKQNTLL